MESQKWPQMAQQKLTEPFRILTVTILSLSLPLSFLLLARLSCAHYLLTINTNSNQPPPSFFFSIILYTNPALLYLFVSIITIITLIHSLTGKVDVINESPGKDYRPGLYTAWIVLCTLQMCVGLGIEGSIAEGIDGSSFGVEERGFLSRIVFFLGLHETMIRWSRVVVKPVVDDTMFGVVTEESWVQRMVMAFGFGSLWWWRLRDEVEALVVVAEAKMEMRMTVGVADFVGWWLYYLTVTIGMVKIVKGLMWVGVVMFCRRGRRSSGEDCEDDDDDKV